MRHVTPIRSFFLLSIFAAGASLACQARIGEFGLEQGDDDELEPDCPHGELESEAQCDDGNTTNGLPGTIMWSQTHNLVNCPPFWLSLALRSDGSPALAVQCDGGHGRLIAFDGDGEVTWERGMTEHPVAMAIGPMDEFAIVGATTGAQGSVATYDWEGQPGWSVNLTNDRLPLCVAIDGTGSVVVGGANWGDGGEANWGDRFLRRYTADGALSWGTDYPDGVGFFAVATNDAGHIWALQADSPRIETYSVSGEAGWVTGPLGAPVYGAGLALGPNDNVYAVTQIAADPQGFRVDKFNGDGAPLWSAVHHETDVKTTGRAIAALPTGGALIAGSIKGVNAGPGTDGLLSWYSPDGVHLQDIVYDGAVFHAVAVANDGDYAIAAGIRTTPEGPAVWLIKVAI